MLLHGQGITCICWRRIVSQKSYKKATISNTHSSKNEVCGQWISSFCHRKEHDDQCSESSCMYHASMDSFIYSVTQSHV